MSCRDVFARVGKWKEDRRGKKREGTSGKSFSGVTRPNVWEKDRRRNVKGQRDKKRKRFKRMKRQTRQRRFDSISLYESRPHSSMLLLPTLVCYFVTCRLGTLSCFARREHTKNRGALVQVAESALAFASDLPFHTLSPTTFFPSVAFLSPI